MLAQNRGVASRESAAYENGEKNDDRGDQRGSAVGCEMAERRIHLR